MFSYIYLAAVIILTLAMTGAGIANLFNLGGIEAQLDAWRLPRWLRYLAAAFELGGAALMILASTRVLGLILFTLTLFGANAVVFGKRAWSHVPPAIILLALDLGVAWATLGM